MRLGIHVGIDPESDRRALAEPGGEFDLWGWAQLRAGYRYNTRDHNTSAASVGVGVSPFGIRMDLAAVLSGHVIGAGFRTGVRF